jgi:hypothetical protein
MSWGTLAGLWRGWSAAQLSSTGLFYERACSEDSEGKQILPVPVILVRDSKLERFEALVRMHTGRYGPTTDQHVTATFIGRIDAVSNEVHDSSQKAARGKEDRIMVRANGPFEAQFTLESVKEDAALR